jgi:hypothetical protein
VPRGASHLIPGREAGTQPESESKVGRVDGVPGVPEGDLPEGPAPQGAGLIADVFPFGRFAPEEVVDRFLARIEELDPRQIATRERVSATLAVLTGAVALEMARRRFRHRQRRGSDVGRGPRIAAAGGDLFPHGLPEWPGSWSASPR